MKHIAALLLFSMGISLLPSQALSEFLSVPNQNSFYLPRDSDGKDGVSGFTILRPTQDSSISGFAFFSAKTGSISTFNPQELSSKSSESIVIVFSATTGTEAVLPNGKRRKIEGEVIFKVGALEVFVDPRSAFPYVAVLGNRGPNASIAAFSGTTEMMNAFDVNGKFSSILFPSSVGDSYEANGGEILLGDVPFSGQSLGVQVLRENPCLLSNTVLLSKDDFTALQSGKPLSRDGSDQVEAARKGNQLPSITEKFVPLRVSSKELVAFNAEAGRGLMIITSADSISGVNVCTYSKLEM